MDEDEVLSVDDIDVESRPPSPQETAKRTGSGLTLVLPSLKSLQQAKAGKKPKAKAAFVGYAEEKPKKPPRPAKLKPLKEVLAKLIINIKKKDSYGFFLTPVDLEQVPGYTDVVKEPMDFGTVANKVARRKYRSLDDFANDIRLVTSNAKLFNPPGTIYYTEAEKIESWALDHIEKAAATVIQYEADWNLDPEKDDSADINVDEDVVDQNTPSASATADMGTPGPSELLEIAGVRRSARAPYKKVNTPLPNQKTVSESIDAEGRLPGSKDGLGAFPPGSALAKTMLDLKLKGKRYKTKKERLRIEKEGPPYRADGSLDYYNMEDPFLMFTNLVPAPLSRPMLTPIYAPLSTNQPQIPGSQSQPPQSQTPQPSTSYPIPTTVPISRPLYQPVPHKGRQWVVTRNTNYRRGKDKEDENDDLLDTDWKAAREVHALDFGSFALLAGELAEEMKRRGLSVDDEQKTTEIIKESLDCAPSQPSTVSGRAGSSVPRDPSDWFTTQAPDAEDYIRDVVYGGEEGFAYVRSLAEFVNPPEGSDHAEDDDYALGMPLAKWVESNVIDPLTGNRHSLLRQAAEHLSNSQTTRDLKSNDPIISQISRSLHVYPRAHSILQLLLQLRTHTIDMGSLIRAPDEIYQSEKEWFGNVAAGAQTKKEDSMDVDTQEPTTIPSTTLGTTEQLNKVFSYVANAITALDRQRRTQNASRGENEMKVDTSTNPKVEQEDPVLRNIRLNLLALAKRAPLDTVALLPRELIPERIRHVIPALTASPTVSS
ncbi:hypothetical protein EV361DRAFT_821326 [Lentinula raphanica]|uniref:Bromo domain-containing protein n=1 Tax=Lentinula raphanica TaxID=153919 RepID=A0AA38PCV6_9AGAR|nr:hypothetical protein F5878DRAFT_579878 [Lentinula raphanica]KAJ3973810.1 hypothetical protein EV361DRAFT_821326 [Lentinula raphanica]